MDDLISRQEAIEALFDWEMTYNWDDHCREEDPKPAYIVSPSDVIEQLPPAQPERKKGHWIYTGSGQECSVCHEIQYGYDNYRHFCPNCGADMRGEEHDK